MTEKDLSSLPQNKAKFGKFYNKDITLDKGAKIIQWGRNCLYKWTFTVKRMNLNLYFIPCQKLAKIRS